MDFAREKDRVSQEFNHADGESPKEKSCCGNLSGCQKMAIFGLLFILSSVVITKI